MIRRRLSSVNCGTRFSFHPGALLSLSVLWFSSLIISDKGERDTWPILTGNHSKPNSPAPHGKSRNLHDNESGEVRKRWSRVSLRAIAAAEEQVWFGQLCVARRTVRPEMCETAAKYLRNKNEYRAQYGKAHANYLRKPPVGSQSYLSNNLSY